MKRKTIQQMVIAGVLTGLAILMGSFAHFHFFGEVYLIGLVIFLMPLFLRLDFLLISTIASVAISDVVSGFGHYAWMSIIVYSIAVTILWVFSKLKFKLLYILGLLVAAAIIILGYYSLELPVFGKSFATKDVIGTAIEMAIVVPIVSILYFPMKIVGNVTKK